MGKRNGKGQFVVGHKGPGRPKGSKNRTPSELRNVLSMAVTREIECIAETLQEIDDPLARLNILSKLLPYVLPKMANTQIEEKLSVEQIVRLSQSEREERIQEIYLKLESDGKH